MLPGGPASIAPKAPRPGDLLPSPVAHARAAGADWGFYQRKALAGYAIGDRNPVFPMKPRSIST